jgi:hypothetical protein
MKISPDIEIMSHKFARDREQDLNLAARDETKRQLLQAAARVRAARGRGS